MSHPSKQPLLRRFVSNLAAVLASDILNKGTTFLIYIVVARELGTYAFGQMSLALTLFYSFQVVATFGMQTLITREVAKDQASAGRYFVNSLAIGFVTSIGSMLLLAGAVFLLDYPVDTRNVILVTALGLAPFAASTICEAVIRGWEKMHLIALVQVPVNLLKVAATIYLIWNGGNILQVVGVIVISRFMIALALLAISCAQLRPWRRADWSAPFMRSIVGRSTTFVGIDTVTAWWTSLNIVLLSKLASETEVGLYNAAAQLMIPMGIFYQSVLVAAFPIMCKKFSLTDGGLKTVSNRLIEMLMIMAIPGTIGLIMVAEPALEFVYKEKDFALAAGVVRITAFILILKALTFTFGHILLAGSQELITLRIVIVNLIVNIVLGWILINKYGITGAAVAALLTRIVDFAQHYPPVRKIVAQIEIGRVIWKPILASILMAAYLYWARDLNLGLMIGSAVGVYFIIFIGFETWMAGGVGNLRARYQ